MTVELEQRFELLERHRRGGEGVGFSRRQKGLAEVLDGSRRHHQRFDGQDGKFIAEVLELIGRQNGRFPPGQEIRQEWVGDRGCNFFQLRSTFGGLDEGNVGPRLAVGLHALDGFLESVNLAGVGSCDEREFGV